jgi:hypothetical protein
VEDKERRQYSVFHAVRNLKYSRAQVFLVLEPEKFNIGDRLFGGTVTAIDKTERWICVGYNK